MLYRAQCMEPGDLKAAARREIEPRPVSAANQLDRHQQNLAAEPVEGGVLDLWRQTEALELGA